MNYWIFLRVACGPGMTAVWESDMGPRRGSVQDFWELVIREYYY